MGKNWLQDLMEGVSKWHKKNECVN